LCSANLWSFRVNRLNDTAHLVLTIWKWLCSFEQFLWRKIDLKHICFSSSSRYLEVLWGESLEMGINDVTNPNARWLKWVLLLYLYHRGELELLMLEGCFYKVRTVTVGFETVLQLDECKILNGSIRTQFWKEQNCMRY